MTAGTAQAGDPSRERQSETTPPASSWIDVDVWRGDTVGQFVRYRVPRQASQTVLDVVTWIQRNLDPTLAYRYACRVGMCGSCAMTVNGVARWTCRTHVDRVAARENRPTPRRSPASRSAHARLPRR